MEKARINLGEVASLGLAVAVLLLTGCDAKTFTFEKTVTARSLLGVPTISIEEGAEFTQKTDVTVEISAREADEMYLTTDKTCETGGQWVSLKKKANWILGKTNGQNALYAKFRNLEHEFVSPCVSDQIIHDNLPPEVSWQKTPKATVNKKSAEFRIQADDVNGISHLECLFPGESKYKGCKANEVLRNLKEQVHDFRVRAVDRAGNISSLLEHAWRVDITPPKIDWLQRPDMYSQSEQSRLAYDISDASSTIVSKKCMHNNQLLADCENDLVLDSRNEQTHKFVLVVEDEAGNKAEEMVEWVTDRTAPVVQVSGLPSDTTKSMSEMAAVQVIETGSGLDNIECWHNNSAVPCSMGQAVLTNIKVGTQVFRARAVDKSGNIGESVHTWTVIPKQICYRDEHRQKEMSSRPQLDVVFVVDSSSSLDNERKAIASGIESFINELPDMSDIRMGVMLAHSGASKYAGKIAKVGSEPAVLSTMTMSKAEIRENMLYKMNNLEGDSGSDGGEMGLYSLQKAVTGDLLDYNRKLGFFRPQAGLAVVFVADENAICARYPAGVTPVKDGQNSEPKAFDRYCKGVDQDTVSRALRDLQGDRPLLVSGIIYTNPDTVKGGGENEVGYGYLEAIQLNSGIAIDLASGNIPKGLSDIGQMAREKISYRTEFTLTHKNNIDPKSIKVMVDQMMVPHQYIDVLHEVQIDPKDAGMANSLVQIDYCEQESNAANMSVASQQ